MSFDIPRFLADLDEIRSLWRAPSSFGGPPSHQSTIICRSAVSTPEAVNISCPFDPIAPSNHQRVGLEARDQRWRALFNRMDANLRRLPALDFPRFRWQIMLHEVRPTKANPNRLPAFHLPILTAPLWDEEQPLRKTSLAAERLALLAADLACIGKPRSGRRFKVGQYALDADTPLDAARLYTALTQPGFLSGQDQSQHTLPSVTEILDHLALARQLRPS